MVIDGANLRGIIDTLIRDGGVDGTIDAYFSWPGFFALAAQRVVALMRQYRPDRRREFFWFYKAGFNAARLLEGQTGVVPPVLVVIFVIPVGPRDPDDLRHRVGQDAELGAVAHARLWATNGYAAKDPDRRRRSADSLCA